MPQGYRGRLVSSFERVMASRRFFFLSLLLALLAVGLHLTAMSQISRGVQIRAQAVTTPELNRDAARAEAGRYSNRGAVLGYVGPVFVLASVVLAVMSVRRREPARRAVIIGVLVCYAMLQLVLV